MNVLIIGSGKGSWTMRGHQIGAAIGARVVEHPHEADWRWADLAILVKKSGPRCAKTAREFGVPIVWDALDCWQQPLQNAFDEATSRRLLSAIVSEIRPAVTIGATEAMAQACGGVYVPHHAWAGLAPTAAAEHVSVVAYEGSERYLGRWQEWLESACRKRGWHFLINPPDLRAADLIVAFRDREWDGWMCREWKSGVKVVNAIASGRPFIGQASAAVRELQPAGSVVETPQELEAAFDAWAPEAARAAAVDTARGQAPAFSLSVIADRYRQILSAVGASCAA